MQLATVAFLAPPVLTFFYDAYLSPEENNVIGVHVDECMQQMCGVLGRQQSSLLFLY